MRLLEIYFRAMKRDSADLPQCGAGYGTLGVRERDIAGDPVVPKSGGMSITRQARTLRQHVSPSHGGEGRLSLFEVREAVTWDDLVIRLEEVPEDDSHSVVEPESP